MPKLKAEGWPGYSLGSADDNTRAGAATPTYRLCRLATPILRRIAVKERTTPVDAHGAVVNRK